MPLREGANRKAINANIKELMASGKSKREAIAISMQKAGKSKRKGKKSGAIGSRTADNRKQFMRRKSERMR
jgi:uncharacterized protein YoaH (UPF0181 family)